MRIIGITGGVGSGKSEILAYIRQHYKCEIYLADEVAHLLMQPGQICYKELVSILGENVLLSDKTIDRKKMADSIFGDKLILDKINGVVHPAVQDFLLEKLDMAKKNQQVELFFIEAALLIESGYKSIADEMWYIFASEATRRARLELSRGYSQEKTNQIIGNQLGEEEFRSKCDFILDNNGALEESHRQIIQKLEAFTWQK